jgi:guanylate kinase
MQIREAAAKDAELAAVLQFVFIAPPSYEVLEKRLRGRQTDSEEQIAIRLGAAKKEISFWKNYDYAVINGDLSQAAAEMIALFRSFRLRTALLEQSDLLD